MARCERLKKNKNFERLAVNSYGKIPNGVSFLTESEQTKMGHFMLKQSAPNPSALVMQNSCVEFLMNFMFTNR